MAELKIDFTDPAHYVDWVYEVVDALHNPDIRYIFLKWGAGAGKSYLIAQLLIQDVMDWWRVWVFRKIRATLRASCHQLIKDVSSSRDLNSHLDIKENLTTEYHHNNGMLRMFWLDDEEKIKSVAWLDKIWIEETTEISYDEFTQLDLRLRWWTNHKIICTFNPISDQHRLHLNVENNPEYKDKAVWINKTAWDNKFVGEEYLARLESLKYTNPAKYRIYAENKRWQGMKWQIFTEFSVFDYNIEPDVIWLDFWYNDPTALTYIKIEDKGEKKDVYIQEKLYETHMVSWDIIARLQILDVPKSVLIVADNARPEIIDDIRKAWYNIIACTKGKDSITRGILQMQQFNIHVNWENAYREFAWYCWKVDKNWNALDVPIDGDDHLIDSSRYAIYEQTVKSAPASYIVDF